MKSLQEICDYLYVNDAVCRSWPNDKFERWVKFHYNEGWICVAVDFDQSIAGIALIRPCMVEDAHDPLSHDYEGNCLAISKVVCTAKNAIVLLGFIVLKRFGQRAYVAWEHRTTTKLIIHKSSVLRRNLFRMLTEVIS
jgi:hypothetical protein